jgi:hypothetical protein
LLVFAATSTCIPYACGPPPLAQDSLSLRPCPHCALHAACSRCRAAVLSDSRVRGGHWTLVVIAGAIYVAVSSATHNSKLPPGDLAFAATVAKCLDTRHFVNILETFCGDSHVSDQK